MEDLEFKVTHSPAALEASVDEPDEAFEIDELIHAAREADDSAMAAGAAHERLKSPDAVLERLFAVERAVLYMERRTRKLESRVFETSEVDTEKGTLTQRIQSLEANVDLLKRGIADKAKRVQESQTSDAMRGQHMDAWRFRPIAKAREEAIEAMLEGGERFELMNHLHIQEYGHGLLDFPDDGQDIEVPDFIVIDALPEVLRRAFVERIQPVVSLICGDGSKPLSLARFDDWQTFARTLS